MCNYRLHNQLVGEKAKHVTTSTSRDLIAVLQMTLDGRILDADGGSDWVDSWADGLELLPPVDAFVLGAGMFSGYEQFWTAMLENPAVAAEMLGRDPYPRELAYASVAARTEHVVLSSTLAEVRWPSARIVGSLEEIRTFKHDGFGAVYVVGGPTLITSLLDAGLLDELRLIVHPIVVGAGRGITEALDSPQRLELVAAEPAAGGRVTLEYRPHRVG
jgi:riboflavin biosynthesis pyrimidine reductase